MNKLKNILIILVLLSAVIFSADLDSTDTMIAIENVDSLETRSECDTLMLQKKGQDAVLGIVMNNDLNFETAKGKQWNEKYGALVSWVKSGSAAEEYGIQDGDIITSFDGQKVLYNDHLRRLIKTKQAGDAVEIVIFRDGKFYKTNVVLGAIKTREKKVTISSSNSFDDDDRHYKRERKKIVYGKSGAGGINWEPMWYSPDWTDINDLAAQYGFSSFDKDMELSGENYPGILLHSISFVPADGGWGPQTIGGLYFSVGKGITKTNKIKSTGMEESLNLDNNFFGFMIGKRVPLFNKILIVPKLKAGWWTTRLELTRSAGDVTWDEIADDLGDRNTSSLNLQRKYYTVTPSFEMIYKFNDSFGIHAGVSYMYGFERHKGWKTDSREFKSYDVADSPNTKLDGYIFTVGPWIFFD